MNDEIKKNFFDVLQSVEEIEEFIFGISYSDFLKDIKTQRAVERNLEIIGEALNRVKRLDHEILERVSEHYKIIGMRNILAHGYDSIDEKILWKAISEHLPILKKEVSKILAQDDQ